MNLVLDFDERDEAVFTQFLFDLLSLMNGSSKIRSAN